MHVYTYICIIHMPKNRSKEHRRALNEENFTFLLSLEAMNSTQAAYNSKISDGTNTLAKTGTFLTHAWYMARHTNEIPTIIATYRPVRLLSSCKKKTTS